MQIVWHGYWNNTGYSIASQDYVLSLLSVKPEINIKLEFINHSIGSGISKNREQLFTALHKKEKAKDYISLYHSIPPRYLRQQGAKQNIGFCVFETINTPPEWPSLMNNMDTILTASIFNKSIFENSGIKPPISIVPHCFDPNLFNKTVSPLGRYSMRTFLSIGTWKTRKNWDTLIKAWYSAFELKDNVCLLIKTDKPQEFKSLVVHIKSTSEWRSKATAPIYCDDSSVCVFEDIPKIMKKADFYISASRGEGFCIPVMHAMALGIPVITTRFGGVLEVAKPEYVTYFEPDKYERILNMDNIKQFSNCIWPHLSVEEISNKMRYVLVNHKTVEEKAQKAYDYVHNNFTYKVIGNKLLSVLSL